MVEQQLYIHSSYTSATSGRTFETINPVSGNVLTTVQAAEREDVNRAVKSAQQGQKIWVAMIAMERSRILRRTTDILRECNDELAKLEALDTGRTYSETSIVDIVADTNVLEYCVGLILMLEGSRIPLRETSLIYTCRKSLGAVAGIGAWSYPIQATLWKSVLVLAAGSAVIFKPNEVTPLTALKLTEIYSEADLPDDVFNVLPGVDAETGQYLTDHSSIVKASFTGGVASGKKVMANSATSSLKEMTMELGDKPPLVVFNDVGLDLAADIATMVNFFSSDQMCANGTHIFTPTKCKTTFEQRVLACVEHTRTGDVFDPQTNLGPLVSFPHRDNVLRYIARGIEEGAHVLCDGDVLKGDSFDSGAWVALTIFTGCSDNMTIVREGILGPAMSILIYESEDEVTHHANDTDYGLAADIVAADLDHAHRVTHQLEAGTYWINTWGESSAEMPVGGYKYSDVGRENGVMTLQSYTQAKPIQVEMVKF